MNFKKLFLALLLHTSVAHSINTKIENGESKKYSHTFVTIQYYPSCIFKDREIMFVFVYATLLYAREQMGLCTNHFRMVDVIDYGHLVDQGPDMFQFIYAREPIYMFVSRDKVREIITLEFIADTTFPVQKVAEFCADYLWGTCIEVITL